MRPGGATMQALRRSGISPISATPASRSDLVGPGPGRVDHAAGGELAGVSDRPPHSAASGQRPHPGRADHLAAASGMPRRKPWCTASTSISMAAGLSIARLNHSGRIIGQYRSASPAPSLTDGHRGGQPGGQCLGEARLGAVRAQREHPRGVTNDCLKPGAVRYRTAG